MRDSEFKRVKHHHFPGDVSKRTKIAMRENKVKSPLLRSGMYPLIGKPAKAFRKRVNSTTKAVLKEKTRKEIQRQLDLLDD